MIITVSNIPCVHEVHVPRFHTRGFVREGKELVWGGQGSLGVWLQMFNFAFTEVGSGGFWGPRRLVAKMLRHVEIDLALKSRGRGDIFLHCMNPCVASFYAGNEI